MLFPQLSRLELRRTLERVGNDFDVAVAAIVGDNDMANCVDDPENRKEHQLGKSLGYKPNDITIMYPEYLRSFCLLVWSQTDNSLSG